MPNPQIKEFAKLLVREVRDATIRSSDRWLRAGPGDVVTQRWTETLKGGDAGSGASVLIPDIVDATLFPAFRYFGWGKIVRNGLV
jgi:hypothetical protein